MTSARNPTPFSIPRALPTNDHSLTVDEDGNSAFVSLRIAPEIASHRFDIFNGDGKNPALHSSRKTTNIRSNVNEFKI